MEFGNKLPDISKLYEGGHIDNELKKEMEIEEAEQKVQRLRPEVMPTPTPDEMPLDAEFVTHPPAGLGTAYLDKPKPGGNSNL